MATIRAPRPDPDMAGEPYHCCLCGQRNPRCLCRRCRLAHTLPDDTLPDWLRALQREAQRLTAHARRRPKFTLQSLDTVDETRAAS